MPFGEAPTVSLTTMVNFSKQTGPTAPPTSILRLWRQGLEKLFGRQSEGTGIASARDATDAHASFLAARAVGEFVSLDPEAAPEAELDFDLDPVDLAALDCSIEQHRLSTAAALGRDSVPARDARRGAGGARSPTPSPPRARPRGERAYRV